MKLFSISARSYLQSIPDISVIKHFFIYSFGSLCLKILSMLVIPLIMRTLTPSDYGTLSLITSFITIATAIIGLGLRQVVSIEYFHCKTEQEKRNLINEVIIIYILLAIPFFLIMLNAQKMVINYIFFNSITPFLYYSLLTIVFFSFFVEFFYQLLQYTQLSYQLTLLQILTALINNTLTILFLLKFKLGISAVIISQLIGTLISSYIAIYAYSKKGYFSYIQLHTTLQKTSYFLMYGFPFIPAIMFSWIIASADRWFLGYYCSMREVGIYSVADLFSQLFYFLVLQPWSGSYLPYIMKKYAQSSIDIENIYQENKKNMYRWISLISIGILLFFVSSHVVFYRVVPQNYHEAFPYILPLLIGQLLLLATYFEATLIQYKKCKYFLGFSMAIPALINVLLNVLWIPSYRIYGATFATLISYLLYFIITILYNLKLIADKQRKYNEKSNINTNYDPKPTHLSFKKP